MIINWHFVRFSPIPPSRIVRVTVCRKHVKFLSSFQKTKIWRLEQCNTTHSGIVLFCVLWSEKLWMQSGKSIYEENNKLFFNFFNLGWLKMTGTFCRIIELARKRFFDFFFSYIWVTELTMSPHFAATFSPKKTLSAINFSCATFAQASICFPLDNHKTKI